MKKTIIRLLLAALIIIFIFLKMDIDLIALANAVQYPLLLIVALLFPLVINPIIVNNRWKTFLGMCGVKESFSVLAKITFTSTFLGLILPSSQGYDLLRILRIEQLHPEHRGKVGGTIIIERLLGLVCLFVIASVAWLVKRDSIAILPILLLLVLVVSLCLFLFSNKCYSFIHNLFSKVNIGKKAIGYLDTLYLGIHTFPFDKTIIKSILLILALQIANIIVVAVLFASCGVNMGFINHLYIMPLVSVLTMLPVTFGGIGLREGGFLYFYSKYGICSETILAVSILYYVVIMLVPAFVGSALYLFDIFIKKTSV